MPRGGYRPGGSGPQPGSGRPKKGEQPVAKMVLTEAMLTGMSPLEYMLSVMRDPTADAARRDRMAQCAAPYVHARAEATGKKAQAEEIAATAERGTDWEQLLAN
jgi:hypothetical protein